MDHRDEQDSTLAAPAVTEHGGRVELRQTECDDSGVVYRARFFLGGPGAEVPLRGTFRISKAAEVTFVPEAEAPPSWLLAFSLALVRTTARSSERRGWPRRITRWRSAPAEDS